LPTTTLSTSWVEFLEIWEPQFLEPSGPVQGLLYLYLYLSSYSYHRQTLHAFIDSCSVSVTI